MIDAKKKHTLINVHSIVTHNELLIILEQDSEKMVADVRLGGWQILQAPDLHHPMPPRALT
jgi:hypothetical protein